MLFGLATLAPACYAAWVSSHRFAAHWPRLRRFTWTWIASLAALAPDRVVVGTAISSRSSACLAPFSPRPSAPWSATPFARKGAGPEFAWAGTSPDWPRGAWVLLVGLVPLAGDLLEWTAARRFQPASLYAFLASTALFLLFSALAPERPLVSLPEVAPEEKVAERGERPPATGRRASGPPSGYLTMQQDPRSLILATGRERSPPALARLPRSRLPPPAATRPSAARSRSSRSPLRIHLP